MNGAKRARARWGGRASVPHAQPQATLLRYNNGAVALHWITAAVVVAQVASGFLFANMADGPAQGQVFTLHKTLGATILLLAVIRLGWRVAHPPPPFPPDLAGWERTAAVWNHRVFYILLFALPLTGLAAVSGHAKGAMTTPLLGGVPLPLIPGVSPDAGESAGGAHVVLVFVTLTLLALHVGAAIKHQVERNRSAGRMPPFKAPEESPRPVP